MAEPATTGHVRFRTIKNRLGVKGAGSTGRAPGSIVDLSGDGDGSAIHTTGPRGTVYTHHAGTPLPATTSLNTVRYPTRSGFGTKRVADDETVTIRHT
jgi:hypothetical protein